MFWAPTWAQLLLLTRLEPVLPYRSPFDNDEETVALGGGRVCPESEVGGFDGFLKLKLLSPEPQPPLHPVVAAMATTAKRAQVVGDFDVRMIYASYR